MKEMTKRLLTLCAVILLPVSVWATPSTTMWTPCVMDFQSPGVKHFGIDNYFTVARKGVNKGALATDLTVIELGWKLPGKMQMEGGIDWLEPLDDALLLNAKVGYPEGVLSPKAPAVELGVFNVGFKAGVTDANIFNLLLGKTIPGVGRFTACYYQGKASTLVSSSGEKANTGYMVAFDRYLVPDKVQLAADYASGKNALGGGGVGIYYYFTKDISVLAGPVWFNDKGLNGNMKWSTQLDINY